MPAPIHIPAGKARFALPAPMHRTARHGTDYRLEKLFLNEAGAHSIMPCSPIFSADIDAAHRDTMCAMRGSKLDVFDCRPPNTFVHTNGNTNVRTHVCVPPGHRRTDCTRGGTHRLVVSLTLCDIHRPPCVRVPLRMPSMRPVLPAGRALPRGNGQAKKNPAEAGLFVSRNSSDDQNLYWPEKANRFTSLLNLPVSTCACESMMPIFGVSGWMRV